MRALSRLEKDFINQILEFDKISDLIYVHNVLSAFYDKDYEIEFYGYEKNPAKEIECIVKLRYKEGQNVQLNRIIGDFISLSYFIDDLLEQGYLVREEIQDLLGKRYVNKLIDRSKLNEYEICSDTVKTKFAKNLQYKFYATELLRELKANNYDTVEKKETKLTRRIAIFGLVISILSATTGTIIPIVKHDATEIDKKSIDYFIKSEKQQIKVDPSNFKYKK